jgi:ABC-2 type transport system ATP-binding protein
VPRQSKALPRPELAVLDDPTIGLDPIARQEFNRDLIEQLQAAGRTVLYSSHLLDEVEAVADGVAILHEGRIVRHASTEALRSDVKQVVLPLEFAETQPAPRGLLDVRRDDRQLAATVDGAAEYVEQLVTAGVDHEVVDLSLDEIFAAFVIGRPRLWPPSRRTVAAS